MKFIFVQYDKSAWRYIFSPDKFFRVFGKDRKLHELRIYESHENEFDFSRLSAEEIDKLLIVSEKFKASRIPKELKIGILHIVSKNGFDDDGLNDLQFTSLILSIPNNTDHLLINRDSIEFLSIIGHKGPVEIFVKHGIKRATFVSLPSIPKIRQNINILEVIHTDVSDLSASECILIKGLTLKKTPIDSIDFSKYLRIELLRIEYPIITRPMTISLSYSRNVILIGFDIDENISLKFDLIMSLTIIGANIPRLGALANANAQMMIMKKCRIGDTMFVSGKLMTLVFEDCRIRNNDLGNIHAPNLFHFSADGCGLDSLNLPPPPSLTTLSLKNNNIMSLESLFKYTGLKKLNLSDNPIRSIEGLENFTKLMYFDAINTNLDFEALVKLAEMKSPPMINLDISMYVIEKNKVKRISMRLAEEEIIYSLIRKYNLLKSFEENVAILLSDKVDEEEKIAAMTYIINIHPHPETLIGILPKEIRDSIPTIIIDGKVAM